jgi:hypothetical protein
MTPPPPLLCAAAAVAIAKTGTPAPPGSCGLPRAMAHGPSPPSCSLLSRRGVSSWWVGGWWAPGTGHWAHPFQIPAPLRLDSVQNAAQKVARPRSLRCCCWPQPQPIHHSANQATLCHVLTALFGAHAPSTKGLVACCVRSASGC